MRAGRVIFDLVKLNLNNPQVVDHILECITNWVKEFDIDGLRLDVAYCLDKNFFETPQTALRLAQAGFRSYRRASAW